MALNTSICEKGDREKGDREKGDREKFAQQSRFFMIRKKAH